jgi:putative FmdB family regulatory protein
MYNKDRFEGSRWRKQEMPLYLYQCDSCGVRFERMQRMSDDPLTDCPECDGHVHRVIQPVGVIFKGSGFYITDNRQVSSPTLAPAKDNSKSQEKKATDTDAGEAKEKPSALTGKEDV